MVKIEFYTKPFKIEGCSLLDKGEVEVVYGLSVQLFRYLLAFIFRTCPLVLLIDKFHVPGVDSAEKLPAPLVLEDG